MGLRQNLASLPCLPNSPEWPADGCNQKLWKGLSSTAPPPQTLPLGGECGAGDGMSPIKMQFSRTFLPRLSTCYLFDLKLSSKSGLGEGGPVSSSQRETQDFQVTCLPKGTGRANGRGCPNKPSLYTAAKWRHQDPGLWRALNTAFPDDWPQQGNSPSSTAKDLKDTTVH